jgi:hypothetical protein
MTHLTNRLGHRGLRWACFPLLLMFVAALTGSPLRAQVDLAGEWTENLHEDMPERGDVAIGDYVSLPINDATRMRADAWDAEQWTMVEHLCHAHPDRLRPARTIADAHLVGHRSHDARCYGLAYDLSYMLPERTIYMDGRPHPPEWAAHTWQGFSTGEWVGDMLKVTTTHLKEGYFRRNGLARSEKATITEYFFMDPKTTLTDVAIMERPGLFDRALCHHFGLGAGYRASSFRRISAFPAWKSTIRKGGSLTTCPGQNPWLNEYSQRTGVPYEAVRGGAETMYPEYQKKLEKMPVPPPLPKESAETGR